MGQELLESQRKSKSHVERVPAVEYKPRRLYVLYIDNTDGKSRVDRQYPMLQMVMRDGAQEQGKNARDGTSWKVVS